MNIWKLIKKLKKYIILIIVFSFFQVLTELALPTLMSNIVDIGIVSSDINYIIIRGLLMLGVSIISIISVILVVYFTTKFSCVFSFNLREKLYKKITSLSKNNIDDFGASTLITRCTNDVNHVSEMFSLGFRLILFAPIMCIGSIVIAYITEPSLSYVIFISVVVLIILISIIFIVVFKKFELIQKLIDKINARTREILNGINVIRAFNKEKYFEKRFDKINEENKRLNLFVSKILLLCGPITLIIVNFASLFVILASIKNNNLNNIEVGSIMAFIQYMSMILMSFTVILLIIIMVPRTLVSLKRIEEILKTESNVKDEGKKILKTIKKIEFKNVSYKYNNAETKVLKNINFILKQQKSYGIIGSSGSGKTTIINLLLRHIEPTEGQILINDIDIKNYTLKSLRDNISYVPQKAKLFKGTIKENIIFNEKHSDENILEVLKKSSIDDFALKNGLNYLIEDSSTNLSGGQKQRLTIARALLKKCDLYIFDDSFSAIDYITDNKIRENIKKETKNKISLIISQRISTIKDCDSIIVIDEGKIENFGSYKTLLNNSKVFKEFINSLGKDK